MHLTNFIFSRTFFLIASQKYFLNHTILINHKSFIQGKDSSQLYLFQFLRLNLPKQNFYKRIVEFDNIYSNIYFWKIIFFLSNNPFNNNIVIFVSKILYFFLRPNFRGQTTLMLLKCNWIFFSIPPNCNCIKFQ